LPSTTGRPGISRRTALLFTEYCPCSALTLIIQTILPSAENHARAGYFLPFHSRVVLHSPANGFLLSRLLPIRVSSIDLPAASSSMRARSVLSHSTSCFSSRLPLDRMRIVSVPT